MVMDSALITNYFPHLTKKQVVQYEQLGKLYEDWNSKINVVSRKDIDQLYIRHVLHSLGIAKVIQFKDNTQILDVGTGGGFPGIPLAIFFPQCHFVLVDAIRKKINVVQDITQQLGLTNVKSYHKRAEAIEGPFDFVLSRAVTKMHQFIPWVNKKISNNNFNDVNNGFLFLKGGDLNDEIAQSNSKTTTFLLSDYFTEDFFETKKVIYVPVDN